MDTEASRGTPGIGNWRPPFRHGTAVLILTRAEAEEPLLTRVAPAADLGTGHAHGPVPPGPAMVDDRLVVDRVRSGRPDVGDRARRSPARLGWRERLWCWWRRHEREGRG